MYMFYVNQYDFSMFKNKIKLIHRDMCIFMHKSIHCCEICKNTILDTLSTLYSLPLNNLRVTQADLICTVKNPHTVYNWHSIYVVPLNPQFSICGFNQARII